MATATEVLTMLRPQGGWVIRGNEYSGIEWIDCESVTQAEFEAGFATYDAWKAQQDAATQAQKQAILDRLGLTEDELRIVLG